MRQVEDLDGCEMTCPDVVVVDAADDDSEWQEEHRKSWAEYYAEIGRRWIWFEDADDTAELPIVVENGGKS